jgi:L-asparaginase II
MAANPILVEVLRGERVESAHRGAVAVVDADGARVLALGAVERAVYPRSAVKALQALPLVETGAAERLGLTDAQLALACASHGGEPAHVEGVAGMLGRAGLDASALACGAHWPSHLPAAQALVRAGLSPTALHNNCSGKHTGMLCLARFLGVDHRGYVKEEHAVQRLVTRALEDVCGIALTPGSCAIDGCSLPTWPIPIERLAFGFARFATGRGLAPERARAAARLRQACAAEPFYVAGTGRFCTTAMQRFGERLFVKTGAEGVFCAALPGEGLGIAVKCDDGAGRAAEAVIAALIARLLPMSEADKAFLDGFASPVLRNWNGAEVGTLRPTDGVSSSRS